MRKQAAIPSPEDALEIVVGGTSRVVGEAYFRALVKHLARALGYRLALVGVLERGEVERIKTIAVWVGDDYAENFVYDLGGTPCENVISKQVCSYPVDVQRQFPSDELLVEMNIHAYLGAPIVSSADRALGLVAVLDVVPTPERAHARWILRSCADRAAAEFERIEAEAALRTSEARYAVAVAGSSVGIWDWDCSSDHVFYSKRYRELLGYDSTDEFPNTLAAWISRAHPVDLERTSAALEGHIVRREPFDLQYRMRNRDGEYRWYRSRGQAFWDEDGVPTRMAGALIDINELVIATQEREQLIGELEHKNAELERFVYTVSHELKSPLVTIEGFVGHLRGDLEQGAHERVEGDIGHISHAVKRMQQLLEGITTLARLGRIVGELEPLELDALVEDARALVSGQADGEAIEIAVVRGPLPRAFGDRVRVLEVLQNLLENAIKFSRDATVRRVEISAARAGDEIELRVRDFGRGVEPEFRTRVFQLFEQLDPSCEGSGIGLAIAKRVVEMHGGRIWCESPARGEGCCFCFTLPAGGELVGGPS